MRRDEKTAVDAANIGGSRAEKASDDSRLHYENSTLILQRQEFTGEIRVNSSKDSRFCL